MGNLNLKGENLMKRTIGQWALTVIIITAFSLTAFSAFAEETEIIKDPVALVNGVKISQKDGLKPSFLRKREGQKPHFQA